MIYLTYADQPSGVYSSQVIDVCHYLNKSAGAEIKLVAFISLHGFSKNKSKIKSEMPDALVLPMLPKQKYWKINALIFSLLMFFSKHKTVIARNVLATQIALTAKKAGLIKKVCFDGRGAIAAEWHEYDVVKIPEWKQNIERWEKNAVLKSDFHIAVSYKLVDYWKQKFGYSGNNHVIIPCTLNSNFTPDFPEEAKIKRLRIELEFSIDDIILVYSGSTAGWQSFSLVKDFLQSILNSNPRIKVLFLSDNDNNIELLKKEFPSKIKNKFVAHADVQHYLMACDYGILIREQTVTNKVAAPTKFAEYLSAGLAILISENIGDYSDFVQQNKCGYVISGNVNPPLEKITPEERKRLINLVVAFYTKEANIGTYKNLIEMMN